MGGFENNLLFAQYASPDNPKNAANFGRMTDIGVKSVPVLNNGMAAETVLKFWVCSAAMYNQDPGTACPSTEVWGRYEGWTVQ